MAEAESRLADAESRSADAESRSARALTERDIALRRAAMASASAQRSQTADATASIARDAPEMPVRFDCGASPTSRPGTTWWSRGRGATGISRARLRCRSNPTTRSKARDTGPPTSIFADDTYEYVRRDARRRRRRRGREVASREQPHPRASVFAREGRRARGGGGPLAFDPKASPILLHHLDGTIEEIGSTQLLAVTRSFAPPFVGSATRWPRRTRRPRRKRRASRTPSSRNARRRRRRRLRRLRERSGGCQSREVSRERPPRGRRRGTRDGGAGSERDGGGGGEATSRRDRSAQSALMTKRSDDAWNIRAARVHVCMWSERTGSSDACRYFRRVYSCDFSVPPRKKSSRMLPTRAARKTTRRSRGRVRGRRARRGIRGQWVTRAVRGNACPGGTLERNRPRFARFS